MTQALAKGGPLPEYTPSAPNPDYIQCPHCERRFQQETAERHIPFCKEKSQRMQTKANATGKDKLNKRTQVRSLSTAIAWNIGNIHCTLHCVCLRYLYSITVHTYVQLILVTTYVLYIRSITVRMCNQSSFTTYICLVRIYIYIATLYVCAINPRSLHMSCIYVASLYVCAINPRSLNHVCSLQTCQIIQVLDELGRTLQSSTLRNNTTVNSCRLQICTSISTRLHVYVHTYVRMYLYS